MVCHYCGNPEGNTRCGQCKEATYCDISCQKKDWKAKHKIICQCVSSSESNRQSVWIQVDEGEGNGLRNCQTNHVFPDKDAGKKFAKNYFGGAISPAMLAPFPFHFMGWTIEVYCDPNLQRGMNFEGKLNGAGIYLGCRLDNGLSEWTSMRGHIFVTGRRHSDGAPLTSAILWGILNFQYDAMDFYDGTIDCDNPIRKLQTLGQQYQQKEWKPRGGDGGVPIYETDVLSFPSSGWIYDVAHHGKVNE